MHRMRLWRMDPILFFRLHSPLLFELLFAWCTCPFVLSTVLGIDASNTFVALINNAWCNTFPGSTHRVYGWRCMLDPPITYFSSHIVCSFYFAFSVSHLGWFSCSVFSFLGFCSAFSIFPSFYMLKPAAGGGTGSGASSYAGHPKDSCADPLNLVSDFMCECTYLDSWRFATMQMDGDSISV